MNSDFSDFIRFFPIFRLFPTSRLLDSTPLVVQRLVWIFFQFLHKTGKILNSQSMIFLEETILKANWGFELQEPSSKVQVR